MGCGGSAISQSSCCLVAKLCLTLCDPWTAAHQASLSVTISQSLLKLMSIESVMPSNHLILCRPLLLLASIFPSIRVFSAQFSVAFSPDILDALDLFCLDKFLSFGSGDITTS